MTSTIGIKYMRNKTSKFLSGIVSLFGGVLIATILKVTHALAQRFDPNTMLIYAPPEIYLCGGNKLCRLLYGIKRSWVFVAIVAIILLAAIFGVVKLIIRIIQKKKQSQNIQPPKSIDKSSK